MRNEAREQLRWSFMKILLADDHGLFRDSMSFWLKQYDNTFEFDFSSSFGGVLENLGIHSYSLIMLDLSMPGMQGIVSINQLCEKFRTTPIVVVSADESPETISSCVAAGASAYVTKSSSGEEILKAIQQVLSSIKYIPVNAENSPPNLSNKKKQILALINDGLSNKTIGERLFLSEGTVKQYISQLFRELKVSNRTQAAVKARKLLRL